MSSACTTTCDGRAPSIILTEVPPIRRSPETGLTLPNDTSAGNVLMQHLEGSPWQYLTIAGYNSWQDFATNESNSVAQTAKKQGGWFQLREHAAFHNDTITDRIAP